MKIVPPCDRSDLYLENHQKDYICEAKPMGSCPLGWQLYNGNCYMINTARSTTWTVAKDSCEAVGATLLKITSDEEQGLFHFRWLNITRFNSKKMANYRLSRER